MVDKVHIIQLQARAAKLVQTTSALQEMNGKHDEIRRRLTNVCVDYPDHDACAVQTAAAYAMKAFCEDREFTSHVDDVVRSCHQGSCKQIDQAEMLKRTQYMQLVTRLPHALVLFGAKQTKLDRKDRAQIQKFMEQISADDGYVIIVGRASKDGVWRKNIRYALDRAENTRKFVVENLGVDDSRVGYITYGHEKMYLTELDAERMSQKKLSVRQANRSALVFVYPCYGARKKEGAF